MKDKHASLRPGLRVTMTPSALAMRLEGRSNRRMGTVIGRSSKGNGCWIVLRDGETKGSVWSEHFWEPIEP